MLKENFNIIITGVGGQGIITMLRILSEAAMLEGFDVGGSELHGLSQREGSVRAHLRFGKKIYSSLIKKGGANLIFALEASEALRVAEFAGKDTIFLINKKFIPYFGGPTQKEVFEKIKKIPAKIHFVEASKICQEKFGQEILTSVFLLSFGSFKNLIPLKPRSILKAVKKVIPAKYLFLNKKVFEIAKKEASNATTF